MGNQDVKEVQNKILEIMKYIDEICKKNSITYYLMGGTALGAVRHKGFIPWDDDLDIFMTPENYEKFKSIFHNSYQDKYILQEWKTSKKYIEYAKVRMNGTTFIENNYVDFKDMHHGIYVDIMILHKVPNYKLIQLVNYYLSKYVTLVALTQRNWRPKSMSQKLLFNITKISSNKLFMDFSYKQIYKYNDLKKNFKYCYFITKANFNQGIFEPNVFEDPKEISFEDAAFMGPSNVENYLEVRFGNYMKMPPLEQQMQAVHADIFDVNRSYEHYLKSNSSRKKL